jgi:[acyl-carrier-protein] S-malonyltransferase
MGKRVLVFPGQGSQAVGMGQDVYNEPVVRATFDEAGAALGYDVAERCFAGPAEILDRTDVTQPALLTVSIALYRLARERGLQYEAALGHSLGEYSALVATGALPFDVAVDLVRRRGAAMQAAAEAAPGGMAAVIGLDDEAVEALCAGLDGVWPANFNSPGQVVVSGNAAGLEVLRAQAVAAGARKVIALKVSGAFHSPLVATAVDALRAPLAGVSWAAPAPAFFSVCSVAWERDGLADLLLSQMVSPVRFTQAVRTLVARGYDSFLEVGPGAVLTGLVKRIEPAATTGRVGDAATLAALDETWFAASPAAGSSAQGEPAGTSPQGGTL